MEQNGVWIGILLLLAVTACALFLARKAAASVEQFREEDHVRFGKEDKG